MKLFCAALVLFSAFTLRLAAADPEIAGSWVGAIATNRGPMDIGLTLTAEKDKLTGILKTAHGDWEITGVTIKDGVWTVAFAGGGNEGKMIGRIAGTKFTGEWKSKMADGTFEVVRVKKK